MEQKQAVTALKKWAKRWFIDAFGGMAQGLFATLIIGTIIEQIGKLIGENAVGKTVQAAGVVAKMLMGAGIGAGVAYSLKANRLIVFAAAVAGTIGAFAGAAYINNAAGIYGGTNIALAGITVTLIGPGNPIGAYLAAIIATEVASLVAGKTKLDIILLPLITVAVGMIVAISICPPIIIAVNAVGKAVGIATGLQPFLMGIIVSVVVGLLLSLPTSSAAMWVAIASPVLAANSTASPEAIHGMLLASGAAAVGCAAHMVGFAVASYRENKVGGLISQGLGTSMLQIPNVMRKPVILLPAVAASAVVGPLSTCVFKLYSNAAGGGMGTSGLVGVINTITESANAGINPWTIGIGVALLFFIIPAAVALLVSELLRKNKIILLGDMKI
ncbi:MAG: PTS sugar transporter subunit IIC [Clostridiales bacterium]|jgi:uncharacterized membrane protein|nr:PTS sugar transporter subunit IIC [Clostridiales bacterium]